MSTIPKKPPSARAFEALVQRLAECEFETSQRLWIAFSGGLDSTVLLRAATAAHPATRLRVVHINHGLSSNADAWESHCEAEAEKLGLNFASERVNLSASANLELAARNARLDVFKHLLNPGDVVATAHHRDDEIESLLWQLGTGRALIGIPARRRLGRGFLWRPLLPYRRETLRAIAVERGFAWVEDESNRDTQLVRNALRHDLLPRLRAKFPEFDANLWACKSPELPELPRTPIAIEAIAHDPQQLRAWLYAYDITPKSSVVDELRTQARARDDAEVEVRVAPHASVRRFQGSFHVVFDAEPLVTNSVLVGTPQDFRFGTLHWQSSDVGLAREGQFTVQLRRGGERIATVDKKIKLADWFQRNRIPPWEREAWPLLYDGDRLVAAPGIGIAKDALVAGGLFPLWQRFEQEDVAATH